MIAFDAETTRLLETAYLGADIVQRRRASFDAVNPQPGETILDIGCGNGLLTAELARTVGPTGRVIGIDPSADMRAAAVERCRDLAAVDLREGRSDALPLADRSVDRAAAVQVFEYLSVLPPSLGEAFRVLRPGGRLVITDMHFDSWIWFSDHPRRMARIMEAWDAHLSLRDVPARLPAALRGAGFVVERVTPLTICDHVLRPDGLANMLLHLIKAFVVAQKMVPAEEAEAFAAEQLALARAGRFFFSLTHFIVTATRPLSGQEPQR
ncbi:MAG: hypothetical protein AcusKO_16630 [Acuticoccus sp.]